MVVSSKMPSLARTVRVPYQRVEAEDVRDCTSRSSPPPPTS